LVWANRDRVSPTDVSGLDIGLSFNGQKEINAQGVDFLTVANAVPKETIILRSLRSNEASS
jgi:hypothetical protein